MINFLNEANGIKDEIIALRRDIHAHPELGRQEFETSKKVEAYLQGLGIETRRVFGTGVLGILRGGKPGPTVGLRADMDALAIEEYGDLPYKSQNDGVMHACGHDAHTAGLLGAAKLLAAHRDELCGTVKLFFQPDEEGDGGAAHMIAEGVMEHPHVDAVFGAHVSTAHPAGVIGIKPGKAYAASNPFDIVITGKAAHGASYHEGIDAIAIAAQVVTALQQIVSRQVSPLDSAVVSIGMISSKGKQRNVVSDEVRMSGIIRTLGPEMRGAVVKKVREITIGIAEAMGAKAEVTVFESYPGIVNDEGMSRFVGDVAAGLLGSGNVVYEDQPTMGTEDFGMFLEKAPGCFYHLGIRNAEKGADAPIHNNRFQIDEDALPILSALHAQLVFSYTGGAVEV